MTDIEKIRKLVGEISNEAAKSVLHCLIGAMEAGHEKALSNYCVSFARKSLEILRAQNK